MRESDFDGFVASYYEHWVKAVKALGDPNRVYDINGWVRDLEGFAEKIREESLHIIANGGKVVVKGESNRSLDRQEVEDRYGNRMADIYELETENFYIAQEYGIELELRF